MGNILIRFWKYKANNTYETVTNTKNIGYPGKDNPLKSYWNMNTKDYL